MTVRLKTWRLVRRMTCSVGLALALALVVSNSEVRAQDASWRLPPTADQEMLGQRASSAGGQGWQSSRLDGPVDSLHDYSVAPQDGTTPTGVQPTTWDGESPLPEQTLPEIGETGCYNTGEWGFQILPKGLVYRAYLAGVKESRFAGVWNSESTLGNIWDISLGGRAAILRYGTSGDVRPQGFELEIEGAGQPRLDLDENRDVDAADFRFGVPLVYGIEQFQFKLAYYHLSSHLGDEYLLKHPGYDRLNYSRDVIVLGASWYPMPQLRFYAEAGYAVYCDVALPWEFQFGTEWAPADATGIMGAPFGALNAQLREELDYSGNFVAQLGWAWRRDPASGLFRLGAQYYNGFSEQFSFYRNFENKVGIGIWYDF